MSSIVHLVDCMEFMKSVPDKNYDLAIVDPPYGISADKFSACSGCHGSDYISTSKRLWKPHNSFKGGGKLKDRILNVSDTSWDSKPPTAEYFTELFRVSKNQIIWGGNYFALPPTRCVVCWDKRQPWENFSQFEMAWTSFDRPAKMFSMRNCGGTVKIHPTQKPVQLYQWLLETFGGGVLHGIRFACRQRFKPHSLLGTGLRLRGLRDRPVLFQSGREAVRREDQAAEAV